jgi:molybdenum cofactor cytidylyltransferase
MVEGPLMVVVLAAGASRRLRTPKQLVVVDGEPLVRSRCRIALDADVGPVAAVIGAHAAAVASVLSGLPLEVCMNAEWEEGQSASLRRAVLAARYHGAAALLVLACDQYRLTAGDLCELSSAWRKAGGSACASATDGYIGPPAVLPSACFADVLRLRGDMGARRILFQPDRLLPVLVENPRAIFDLDVPADLDVASRRTGRWPR